MAYVPVIISGLQAAPAAILPATPLQDPVIISNPINTTPVLLADAPSCTAKVGRTVLTGVIVGQDSSSIPRRKGFNHDCFYVGEPVSITRSDGRKTFAEVLSVSATGLVLDVGSGVQKNYSPTDTPHHVNKLLGAYYFRE